MKLFKNLLFRHRIFYALVFITLLFLSAMAAINYYQNSRNFENRKITELRNTSNHIQEHVNYQLNSGNFSNAASVLQDKVLEFSNVYNQNINVYDLQGRMLASNLGFNSSLRSSVVQEITEKKSAVRDTLSQKDLTKHTFYSLLYNRSKPEAIIEISNTERHGSAISQAMVLIRQYVFLIIFLLILSGFVAWMISKSLTRKINLISDKIKSTELGNTTNLNYEADDEIKPLVTAYNQMGAKIQMQKNLLQKNERAEAWKEMARQVAHEINNPLTPLRLTVQNFNRKFDPADPDNNRKVKELTNTVVHQIDLISAITKSFSDFAKMPVNSESQTDVADVIAKSISIFPPEEVTFTTNTKSLYYQIDSMYLTRIITNIVKNGLQAIPDDREKKIEVDLKDEPHRFLIAVSDNGTGISDEEKNRIFEANYTTKSEGMGLGLSMVKKIVEDYNGKIWLESQLDFGTVFFIEFTKTGNAE